MAYTADATITNKQSLFICRQKHNAVIGDLGDQIDVLNKAKAK